jgi:parvulin-like peptidyl-prolyl isomerase
MTTRAAVAVAVAVAVHVYGAARADHAPVGAVATIDRPVAFVDGVPIWQSELDDQLAIVAHGKLLDHDTVAAVLEIMIDDQLLLAKLGRVEIPEADIDEALDEIRKQNQLTDAELESALAANHMTRSQYRVELTRMLRIARAVHQEVAPRVVVSEDDIKRAYAERKAADASLGPIETMREQLREYVYSKKMETARAEWLADRHKRARIDRRLR